VEDSNDTQNAADFFWRHDDVFGRIAKRYDMLCDVFSLGIHRLWKRRVARKIAGGNWNVLMDGATGTGDIVLRLLAHRKAEHRTVIASDISPGMLAIARGKLAFAEGIRFMQIDVEAMTDVAGDSVDVYSLSLVLKICNRREALLEAYRILRPGGRIVILEASNIRWQVLHRMYLAYMTICMPILGWLATGGDAGAYRYLLHGIRDFPGAEEFAQEISAAGFEDVAFERLSLGIVAIHSARKPH